jgi:hypothetical protein
MKRRKPLATLALIMLCASPVHSQSTTALTPDQPKPLFPQWVRDIRRAEIVAFGAFPFAMFFSIFAMDTYRSATHDWDSRYYPWPLKGPGAIAMDSDEHILTLGIAATGSLVIALADHLILQYKRARANQQRLDLPEGDIIILRKPWPPEEAPPEETAAPDQAPEGETDP